jgi:hypothetical protein
MREARGERREERGERKEERGSEARGERGKAHKGTGRIRVVRRFSSLLSPLSFLLSAGFVVTT